MWILPKQLHTSPFVQATEELISDLNEQSQICEQSLLARSKPTLARIWLRKWNKESWTQHLSGRILNPFLGEVFVDAWISSLEASLASHSAKRESRQETKTLDISFPSSCTELPSAVPLSCSSKTSKESSLPSSTETTGETLPERPFCSMSLESWNEWVTQRRQECSARKKSAHRIEETECSSSARATPNQRDWKDSFNQSNEGSDGRTKIDQLPRQVFHDAGGLLDRDKSSSTGSRQESWATPNTLDHLDCRTPEGVLRQATGARKGRERPANLREQVDPVTVAIYREASWPTPNMPSGGPLKDGSAIVGMNGGPGHREVIKKHFGAGAKLNPDWVCTLMGIPVGWVSVNDEGNNRIDELRLLGNGVVPQTAEKAFRTLIKELSK
jgi:hypothetical protein